MTFLEDGNLRYRLKLGGTTVTITKALVSDLLNELPSPIMGMGWSASAGEPVTVDRENGATLLDVGLNLEQEEAQKNYYFLVKAYWEEKNTVPGL